MKCSSCPNELVRGNHFSGSGQCHECSLSSAYDTIDGLAGKCDRYEAALRYYADEHHYQAIHAQQNCPLIMVDRGAIANEALAETRK